MYGEDAQIMRRYLKLRMPFTRGPIPKEPIFSVDADEMRSIHLRFNQSYYQKNPCSTVLCSGESTTTELDDKLDSDESEIQAEESDDDSQQKTYSYTQGAEVVDDFFGSSSNTQIPILKMSYKRSIKQEVTDELHRKRRATLRRKFIPGDRQQNSKL